MWCSIGERGIGKTSLLHMLTQAAQEARYIVVYSSCGANSTFDETFRAAAADIPLLFHSGFAPTTAEAETGSTLADLLPPGPLSPRKFGDLCAKLTGTRVLIILDEFDRCESGAFRRDVAELIKNLSDRLGRVQLVLAGVAADLTELVEHIPSIRRNIFAAARAEDARRRGPADRRQRRARGRPHLRSRGERPRWSPWRGLALHRQPALPSRWPRRP